MRITEALLAEHVVFHTLFDYLERTVPRLKSLSEIRALAQLLEAMLAQHSQVEDALLIEPLEPSFCQLGHDENFHAEHTVIEEHLQQIRHAKRVAPAQKLLLSAVVASRKHFDKEERLVFPLAEKQLSLRSQEALGKRWAKQRQAD
jgi:hemerythrin-like domain-containing protein